jgi:S-DNA-T family DNA segregation ATPase FtsK/SpoIIIE
MPRNEPKHDAVKTKTLREVVAVVWLGCAVLTLLSLVSYDKADYWFYSTVKRDYWSNFIGPVGAFVSLVLIFLFGLAAYAVPFLMLVAGLLTFACRAISWLWKSMWAAVFMVSLSCILHLQRSVGWVWAQEVNAVSPGGFIGMTLDELVLRFLLNDVGAAVVLSVIYGMSVICLFELHPRTAWTQFSVWYEAWRERRALARASRDPLAALQFEKMQLDKRERELLEQMKKGGQLPAAAQALSRAHQRNGHGGEPEPTIIDVAAADRPEGAPAGPRQSRGRTKASATGDIEESKEKEEAEAPEPAPVALPSAAIHRPKPPPRAEPSWGPPSEVLLPNYRLPALDLLMANDQAGHRAATDDELRRNSDLLVQTLRQFGILVRPGPITPGPTITRYEIYPEQGVRVDRIKSLHRDLARVMCAEKINIMAPIPGKDSVGVEVANHKKVPILLRDLFESGSWARTEAKIPLAIGKDVYGHTLIADLAAMPHMLIAGTTGSGKSVCINCILLSLLYRFHPEDLRLILVDPKQVEMQIYNQIPHLVVPVVTDPKKVLMALRWVIKEMEDRYRILAKVGVRNVTSFNKRGKSQPKHSNQQMELGVLALELAASGNASAEGVSEAEGGGGQKIAVRVPREDDVEIPEKLPYIVVIIDELADLMQTAPADVEGAIARLTAKARAAGIHLILATQTPRKDVVTGVIKTNIPSRIAFQVPSALDSRVILDDSGAENLLGKGDLLYLPPGSPKLERGQGAFVSDEEVASVVKFLAAQAPSCFNPEVQAKLDGSIEDVLGDLSEDDTELLSQAWEVLRTDKKASTSHIQRRLRIGYNRAAWAIDQFERLGIVSPADPDSPGKPREVLVDLESFELPI